MRAGLPLSLIVSGLSLAAIAQGAEITISGAAPASAMTHSQGATRPAAMPLWQYKQAQQQVRSQQHSLGPLKYGSGLHYTGRITYTRHLQPDRKVFSERWFPTLRNLPQHSRLGGSPHLYHPATRYTTQFRRNNLSRPSRVRYGFQ